MSEQENTEETTVVETEETADTSNEDTATQETEEEISYEQALEWKKKAERLEKAEKTLVEQKRKLKELESKSISPESDDAPMTRFDFELEKFIEKNPEIIEYKDEIAKIAKEKKLTLAQAKILVEADDKTIANRKKSSLTRISDGDTSEPNVYTKEQLARLDPKNPSQRAEYNRIMDRIETGKARLK